jgi:hypothetical protein
MTTEDKMTIEERYKYLSRMQRRYDQADKAEKSRLLDEMQTMTGMHRKALLRLLRHPGMARKARRKQRGRRYSAQVDDAIRVIRETLDGICPERLTPALPEMARHLARFGELQVTDSLLQELGTISVATVGRIVQRITQDEPRLPQRRGRPRYAPGVAAQIPTRVIPWDEREPGHFEVDSLVHCDGDVSGDHVWTLQMIDVATAWSERVAVFGRGEQEVAAGFVTIVSRCPFPILEVHPDNGPEFMNAHLYRFFGQLLSGVQWSRSRPYHKNDNRMVEQKNSTLVRAYLGHLPLRSRQQRDLLNDLYGDMWLYYNFFQPVLRQVAKTTIITPAGIAHTQRQHDQAKTPLQRLLETQVLPPDRSQALEDLYRMINPRELRRTIDTKLQAIFRTVRM